jgi:ribosomal protein S18 acetylase RimI-like enzyme
MQKLTIRRMTTADVAFAVRLTDTRNWDLTRRDFRFMRTLEPYGCFTALQGAARIGTTTTAHFGRVGWIGNVIVDSRHRSKGIGAKLVRHATDYLTGKSARTIGLYAYMDTVAFYEKLGFRADSSFVQLVGHGVSTNLDQKQVKRMIQEDLEDAINFDKSCAGWNRERLLRSIFKDSDDLCCVARDQGMLLGFIMADWYRQQIGPCLCYPENSKVAVHLLKAVLRKLNKREVRIGVPENRAEIIKALKEMNFKEEFKVVRMYWGELLEDTGCLLAMESLERG